MTGGPGASQSATPTTTWTAEASAPMTTWTAEGVGAVAVLVVLLALGLAAAVGGVIAAVRRRLALAAGVGAPGAVATGWSADRLVTLLDAAGLLVWAEVAALLLPAVALLEWHHWASTRGQVLRASATERRRQGVATMPELIWRGSRLPLLRMARQLRPSLRSLTTRELLRTRPEELGVRLVRHGLVVVWAAIEDVVVVFGRPRVGKSTWLIPRILDAPGAVVTASTKADLWAATYALRAERGPVYVFNPEAMGDPHSPIGWPIPSTIRFDPVSGCADPVVAIGRAEDMIPCPEDGGDAAKWAKLARDAFAGLLYTAAITGNDMAAVGTWVAHATSPSLALELEQLVQDIDGDGSVDEIMLDRLRSFLSTNDKTKTSIITSMTTALAWLAHPEARKVAAGGHTVDVAQLIAAGGTVYLIGGESGATAGLLAGLTGHIAREAKRLAGRMPGARLDPPLRMCLDEADRICPVPLPSWVADMGGRGVNIIACFQSRAQVLGRWGQYGAKTIIDCAGAILLYAMATDSDEADYWSRAIGNREEETVTRGTEGMVTHRSTRIVPIVPPARLRRLRVFQAVVLRGGCGPVIGYPARPPRRPGGWNTATARPHASPALAAPPAVGQALPHGSPGAGAAGRPAYRPRPRPMPAAWAPEDRPRPEAR